MSINDFLKQRNITKYNLAINSDVPYSTLNDLCSGKTDVEKCSAETLYRISRALMISMDELYHMLISEKERFEEFRSIVRSRISAIGYDAYIEETIGNSYIDGYWQNKMYRECFYMLAMLDYACRKTGAPLWKAYDGIRAHKLNRTLFPASLISERRTVKEKAMNEAIPEFMRFNIVEFEENIKVVRRTNLL